MVKSEKEWRRNVHVATRETICQLEKKSYCFSLLSLRNNDCHSITHTHTHVHMLRWIHVRQVTARKMNHANREMRQYDRSTSASINKHRSSLVPLFPLRQDTARRNNRDCAWAGKKFDKKKGNEICFIWNVKTVLGRRTKAHRRLVQTRAARTARLRLSQVTEAIEKPPMRYY